MSSEQPIILSAHYSFDQRKLLVLLDNGVTLGLPSTAINGLSGVSSAELNPVTVEKKGTFLRFNQVKETLSLLALLDLVGAPRTGQLIEHEPQPKTPFEKEQKMSNDVEYYREVSGIASAPDRQVPNSHVFIVNPCSVKGEWNEFLGVKLSELDGVPQAQFTEWKQNGKYLDQKLQEDVPFELGNIQLANLKPVKGAIVINALIKDLVDGEEQTVTRYWAASSALVKLYDRLFLAKQSGRPIEVHFQHTESIDGTDWHVLAILIQELATEFEIFTTVYHAE
jgi:hypothetical protein